MAKKDKHNFSKGKRLTWNSNQMKMREALEFVAHLDDNDSYTSYDITVAIQKAKDALSASARNCDEGTLTEQQQRFHDFCEKMQHTDKACCGGCPIVHLRMQGIIGNSCELAWAQMPYTEEGDNDD